MAAPNIINATTINGKTTGANLTSNVATTVLNNAANSGQCMKINTLLAANYTASAANITINWNNAANISGTNFALVSNVAVPANSTLNVIDKTSQIYLEENQSLGATAGTANAIIVTCSYEVIS